MIALIGPLTEFHLLLPCSLLSWLAQIAWILALRQGVKRAHSLSHCLTTSSLTWMAGSVCLSKATATAVVEHWPALPSAACPAWVLSCLMDRGATPIARLPKLLDAHMFVEYSFLALAQYLERMLSLPTRFLALACLAFWTSVERLVPPPASTPKSLAARA